MSPKNKVVLTVILILQIITIGSSLFLQVNAQTELPEKQTAASVTDDIPLYQRARVDRTQIEGMFGNQTRYLTTMLEEEVQSNLGGYALYDADLRLAPDNPIRHYTPLYTVEGFVQGQDNLHEKLYISYERYSYQEESQAKQALTYMSELPDSFRQKPNEAAARVSSSLEHQSGMVLDEIISVPHDGRTAGLDKSYNLVVYWFFGVQGKELVAITVHGIEGPFAEQAFERLVQYGSTSATEISTGTTIYLPLVKR